jgi:hypothetical protein
VPAVGRCIVCKEEARPGRGGPWIIDHDPRCRYNPAHENLERIGGDIPAIVAICHACEEIMVPTHFRHDRRQAIIKDLKPDTNYAFVGHFTHDSWRAE